MSANAMAIQNVQIGDRTWLDTLHEWLTTVDHKKIGVLYVLYALLLLVIGGTEAFIIRIQLMHSHNHFVSPATDCPGQTASSALLRISKMTWPCR